MPSLSQALSLQQHLWISDPLQPSFFQITARQSWRALHTAASPRHALTDDDTEVLSAHASEKRGSPTLWPWPRLTE